MLFFTLEREILMKERIEEKLNQRLEIILEKDVKDITNEEYLILKSKLSEIKYDEGKEERSKKYAETIADIFAS